MRPTSIVLAVAALLLPGCSEPQSSGGPSLAPSSAAPLPFECDATAFRQADINISIDTSAGAIAAVLYGAASPLTVCNFLRYIEDDYYDATVWHRVCEGFVIQAGGLDALGQSQPTREPIRNEGPESQLRNFQGTIAMARTSEPDSATTHFFVNLVDNLRLDFDGDLAPGYAVFGNVTGGWDVVEDIAGTMVLPSPQGGCDGRPVPTMETTIRDILVVA